MLKFFSIVIFTTIGHAVYCQETITFSYLQTDPNGPSNWGKLSAICGKGLSQSPINLLDRKLTQVLTKTPLIIEAYSRLPQSIKVFNAKNSLGFVLNYPDNKPSRLSGGPLVGTYLMENLHFHFGESEHRINNIKYAAEVHMVHYNSKYNNLTAALLQPDGIAVVAVLFQLEADSREAGREGEASPAMPFIRFLPKVLRGGTESVETQKLFTIQDVIKSKILSYYSYNGSITVPPCSEAVTWIVAKRQLTITPAELAQFNQLRNEKGGLMTNNWRPTQDTNTRIVYSY